MPTPISHSSKRRQLSNSQFGLLCVAPLVIYVVAMVIYPLGYSMYLSLNRVDMMSGAWNWVGAGNYVQALSDPYVLNAFVVTVRLTLEVVGINLLVGTGIAVLMNEAFRGRSIVRVLVLLPWAVSDYMTAATWAWLYSGTFGFFNGVLYSLGITSDYFPFLTSDFAVEFTAIAYSWKLIPLGAYFILASLQVIPSEQYRAAMVDGLGLVSRFRRITLPYLRYPLMIIAILTTLFTMTAVELIYVLTGGGPGIQTNTVAYRVFSETFVGLNLGYGAAISYLLIILVLAFSMLYLRLLLRRKQ